MVIWVAIEPSKGIEKFMESKKVSSLLIDYVTEELVYNVFRAK